MLNTRLFIASMSLKVSGSQLSVSSLHLTSFHSKREVPLDLMACHIGSGENLQRN